MKRSAIAFARGALIGVRMIRMSAPAKTASRPQRTPPTLGPTMSGMTR
jgi:hypothetical protein